MKAIHLLIICMLYIFPAKGEDTRKILDAKLSTLKKLNKLDDWLYARIAYNAEKPSERLAFLMASETETWRKPMTNAEHEAWLNLLINQGYYQLYVGNVMQSIEQYEKAYAYYQQKPLKEFDLVEYIFKPLGNNYTRLGDYNNAIFIQQKSLGISLSKHDSLSIASNYSNLAISFKSMGDLVKAESMCLKGFNYLRPRQSLSGLLNSTLADIQYEKREYDKATKSIVTAIDILFKNDSNTAYWLLSAYTLAGNIAQKQNDFVKAKEYYNRGLLLIDTRFKGSRKREKANLLIQSGSIFIAQKNPAPALMYYNKALQILLPEFKNTDYSSLPSTESLYGENRLYDALEGRANALLLLDKKDEALNNYLLALSTGDKSRNEFASTTDRLTIQKQSKRLAELAITTAYDLWIKTGRTKYSLIILRIAEQTKARTLLDQIQRNQQSLLSNNNPLLKKQAALKRTIIYYEKEYLLDNRNKTLLSNKQEAEYKLAILNKEIKRKYPVWNNVNALESSSAEKLLYQIPAELDILNFFWGNEHAYIIKAKKGRVDTIIQLNNAQQLKAKINNYIQFYFKRGPEAMANNPERFFKNSYQVYQQLLLNVLRGDQQKKLVIVADDILGYLPFESLITSGKYSASINEWPFLIKSTSISYAYSMQTWLSPMSESSPQNTFSGFFISKNQDGGPAIPAVILEADELSKNIKGDYFIDHDASLKNFKEALNRTEVLHLSTHAFMFGNHSEPALQLADGKFFLLELTAQAKVPNLIVLSACRTADGIMASGEGVLSLSRGFTAAGTTGVVAGLWNINDKTTSQLITSFYQKLRKGSDAAMALHESKIAWLKQKHKSPALLLPYYWSSLIYIGKPQEIKLATAVDGGLAYGGLAVISIILSIVFLKRRKASILNSWSSGKAEKVKDTLL